MSVETQTVGGYRDLLVWQKGILLARSIYELTATLPSDEKYGLISQMRRAAISVPSHSAEGQARRTTGEFFQFLSHADGSLAELDTQIVLIIELGLPTPEATESTGRQIIELRKMLNSLRRKLPA